MILFRLLGYVLAIAGFGFLIVDGALSIAAGELVLTSLGEHWYEYDRESLGLAQAAVQRYVDPYLWDPIIQTVLQWPTFAVALVLGLLFVLIGRPRSRRRSHATY